MRRKLSLIGSLVVSALCCAGAALADGDERPGGKGFVAPVYNWSGVYFGVHGGYGWGDSKIEEDPLQIGSIIPSSFSGHNDVQGGLGGFQLGVNKQFDHFVLGGEFRISGANIDGSTSDCAGLTTAIQNVGAPPGLVNFNCTTTVNWIAAALARLGYAHDRWLGYGMLGFAIAGVDYKSNININVPIPGFPGITLPSGSNETADGFAYGGGVEYAVTDSVILGIDYLGATLKDSGSGLFLGGIVTSGNREVDFNAVTARLNLKFGG
jgi:outer membrane immunogenic protein